MGQTNHALHLTNKAHIQTASDNVSGVLHRETKQGWLSTTEGGGGAPPSGKSQRFAECSVLHPASLMLPFVILISGFRPSSSQLCVISIWIPSLKVPFIPRLRVHLWYVASAVDSLLRLATPRCHRLATPRCPTSYATAADDVPRAGFPHPLSSPQSRPLHEGDAVAAVSHEARGRR